MATESKNTPDEAAEQDKAVAKAQKTIDKIVDTTAYEKGYHGESAEDNGYEGRRDEDSAPFAEAGKNIPGRK